MNNLSVATIRSPSGINEECALFEIDDIYTPFVLHNITQTGQQYTLSLYVCSESPGSIITSGITMETNLEWKQYIAIFTAENSDVPIYFGATGKYYVYYSQLEIGNKATDWTPAPEDTESKISTISTQYTQLADRFNWLVTSDSSQSSLTLTDSMLAAMVKQFIITSPDGSATIISGGKITTNNIVGTNGWINLALGTFNYGNGALSWDGNKLNIGGSFKDEVLDEVTNGALTVLDDNLEVLQSDTATVTSDSEELYANNIVSLIFAASDGSDGWVYYFNRRITIPKFEVNLSLSTFGNVTGFIVHRANGVNYVVWYENDKWYGQLADGAGSSFEWTWISATDIVLAEWTKKSAESIAYQVYSPAQSYEDIRKVAMLGNWAFGAISETTTINGGLIQTHSIITDKLATDAIKSLNYVYTAGTYSDSGSFFDLEKGSIISKNFAIDENGNAYFNGKIESVEGKIGGWNINTTSIYKGSSVFGTAGTGNMYFGNNGLSISDTFKVDSSGNLTCSGGTITGAKLVGTTAEITSGTIASFTIHSSFLEGNNIRIYNGSTLNGGFLKIGGSEITRCLLGYMGSGVIFQDESTQTGFGALRAQDNTYDTSIGNNMYTDLTLGVFNRDSNTFTEKIWLNGYNGSAIIRGETLIDASAQVVGTLTVGSTSSNAGIEIYHDTPFVDFHANRSDAVDFTSRIIADTDGGLTFYTQNGGHACKLLNGFLWTYGDGGWYNGSHGGGWNMTDDVWVRTFGEKSVYTGAGSIYTSGGDFLAHTNHGLYCQSTGHWTIRTYDSSAGMVSVGVGNGSEPLRLFTSNKTWSGNSTTTYYSTTSSSDKRLKKDLNEITEAYEKMYMDTDVYSFRYILEDDIIHYGFMAQDAISNMKRYGIPLDNNLYGKTNSECFERDITGDDYTYNINYLEWIPLNKHMITKTIRRVDEHDKEIMLLKERVEVLKEENKELKRRLNIA